MISLCILSAMPGNIIMLCTGQDSVGVQVFCDGHVALHNGVVAGRHTPYLETRLHGSESLDICGHLTIGNIVAILQAGALGSGRHFLLNVQGLLHDVTSYFMLSKCGA